MLFSTSSRVSAFRGRTDGIAEYSACPRHSVFTRVRPGCYSLHRRCSHVCADSVRHHFHTRSSGQSLSELRVRLSRLRLRGQIVPRNSPDGGRRLIRRDAVLRSLHVLVCTCRRRGSVGSLGSPFHGCPVAARSPKPESTTNGTICGIGDAHMRGAARTTVRSWAEDESAPACGCVGLWPLDVRYVEDVTDAPMAVARSATACSPELAL